MEEGVADMKAYVARQPIYDQNGEIFAYELLYRSVHKVDFTRNVERDRATQTVLSDAVTTIGMGTLTGGRRAFVNFTGSLILSQIPDLLSPQDFVIEILEDTVVDDLLLRSVKERKQQGFTIALDDYIGDQMFHCLLPLIDIVKVDFKLIKGNARRALSAKLRSMPLRMLAEKVETEEEYAEAKADGYTLFQGYYFGRPVTLSAETPKILESTCVRMFQELTRTELDFAKMTSIIRMDVDLTYKLLTHVNTLQYYRGYTVNSIYKALLRMGVREVRRWLTLVFIRDFVGKSNEETAKTAFVRASFSEKLATMLCLNCEDNAFLMGMFSMIHTVVEGDLPILLEALCLEAPVKDALLGKPGILNEILVFVKNYENGNWEATLAFTSAHALDQQRVVQSYVDAVALADQSFL